MGDGVEGKLKALMERLNEPFMVPDVDVAGLAAAFQARAAVHGAEKQLQDKTQALKAGCFVSTPDRGFENTQE